MSCVEMGLMYMGCLVSFAVLMWEEPGPLAAVVLAETLCLVVYMYWWGFFSWLGYILILIFWGSMMVLLLYGVCLSPNLKLGILSPHLGYYLILALLSLASCTVLNYFYHSESVDTSCSLYLGFSLMSEYSIFLFIYSICNLLVVLLLVCELSLSKKGPLIMKFS